MMMSEHDDQDLTCAESLSDLAQGNASPSATCDSAQISAEDGGAQDEGTVDQLAVGQAAEPDQEWDEASPTRADVASGAGSKPRQWEIGESIAAVLAASSANRHKSSTTNLARAKKAKEYAKKYVNQMIRKGIWTPEVDNHPTYEEFYAERATYSLTGKNKGKSPLMSHYKDMVAVVQNKILPIVSKELGPDKKPPSGKQWPDVLKISLEKYWDVFSAEKARLRGKPMPSNWEGEKWPMCVCDLSAYFCGL